MTEDGAPRVERDGDTICITMTRGRAAQRALPRPPAPAARRVHDGGRLRRDRDRASPGRGRCSAPATTSATSRTGRDRGAQPPAPCAPSSCSGARDVPQVVLARVHGPGDGGRLPSSSPPATSRSRRSRPASPRPAARAAGSAHADGRRSRATSAASARWSWRSPATVIDAPTALEWGLVNRVVPDDELDKAVRDLMDRATAGSRPARAWGKQTMYAQLDRPERGRLRDRRRGHGRGQPAALGVDSGGPPRSWRSASRSGRTEKGPRAPIARKLARDPARGPRPNRPFMRAHGHPAAPTRAAA
jgi:hypothetical protein